MVDRIRWDTVSYLPFYYVFFQFLLLTIFNLQANILTTKDILSNLAHPSYFTRDNYISIYHRKKTLCVRYPKLFKTTLFNFERLRCLATHKKKSVKKFNQ